MSIVVYASSGLGNQLFQYAAGLHYATKYRRSLRVISDPQIAISAGYPRPFQLDKFTISAPMSQATVLDRVICANRPVHALAALAGRLLNARRFREPQAACFLPNLPFERLPRTIYLRDYWQAAGYAESVETQLRRELELKNDQQPADREIQEQIALCKCPVSVHVRAGDYAYAQNPMILSAAYYRRAWEVILKRFGDAHFFIFSDDSNAARTILPENAPRTHVAHNTEFTAYQDLRLMASCDHHIIANSSFSWWGAWLNPKTSKTVIAPKFWRGTTDSYLPDLLPASWHLLDNLVG